MYTRTRETIFFSCKIERSRLVQFFLNKMKKKKKKMKKKKRSRRKGLEYFLVVRLTNHTSSFLFLDFFRRYDFPPYLFFFFLIFRFQHLTSSHRFEFLFSVLILSSISNFIIIIIVIIRLRYTYYIILYCL